jgi:hypothetical protein
METTTTAPEQLIQDAFAYLLANYNELFNTYKPLLYVAAALYAAMFLFKVVRKFIPVHTDSQRLYTKAEKHHGFARAGNRCEMDGFLFFRCSRKAEHGDHHYPHSRGGATSMKNFVAACAKCNMSKGAKIPGYFATKRIEGRRRGYFPKGTVVTVGERITRKSRKLASAAQQNSY